MEVRTQHLALDVEFCPGLLATDPDNSVKKLQNGMDPEIIDTDTCGISHQKASS